MGLLRPFSVLEQANFSGNFHQNTGNFSGRVEGGEGEKPSAQPSAIAIGNHRACCSFSNNLQIRGKCYIYHIFYH